MNRRTISLYAVAMAFAALLITTGAPKLYAEDLHVSATCSSASLTGLYGFYRTGFRVEEGPIAGVGICDFDGKGNWTVLEHTSRNGKFAYSKFSGRIEIAPDCRFKAFNESGDLLASGVVVDDGKEFILLNRRLGNSLVLQGKKVHSK
jgi:hypothetical protein